MNYEKNSEITREELIYISRQFANMFGFPVRLYNGNELIFFHSTANLIADPVSLCFDEIIQKHEQISYYVHESTFYYGIVNCGEYKFITGPVGEIRLSDHEFNRLGFMLGIEKNDIPLFTSSMKSLSGIHLDTLIQAIILYNFSVNRTMCNISDIRIKNSEQNDISSDIKENEISYTGESFFMNNARSYAIERDMIKKVMNGDVEGLIDGATKIPSVSSGNLAPHLLRHNKNFFIKLETIMARTAIESGLDVDEIFSIEEMYIRKCESLDNIDRIKNLQYHMIIDYADRVKKLRQYNGQNSKMVTEISKYIRSHISEAIKTSDIADYFGKSRGGITTEFKKQTGMNLSDFIKLKKIQEAQELLYETNKSLVTISDYLGFSSQSHFTRVFKEITGITPKEYRDKNHIGR
ncbi:MAG: AraC family transcriptional regulator [Alistipes senegalensis]|nr:AraC family transcriptional regulator [Alistipes senegalensis]